MTIPRWLKDKTPQEKGRRFEKKLAKKIGGRAQLASGSLPFFKEDIETDTHLVQVKTTTKKSFKLNLEDLEALQISATKRGKAPLFMLQMGGKNYYIRYDYCDHD